MEDILPLSAASFTAPCELWLAIVCVKQLATDSSPQHVSEVAQMLQRQTARQHATDSQLANTRVSQYASQGPHSKCTHNLRHSWALITNTRCHKNTSYQPDFGDHCIL